jgi:hypothetical protein
MATNIPFAEVGTPATNTAVSLPVIGNDLQNKKARKEPLDLYSKRSNSSNTKDMFQSSDLRDVGKYLEDV